MIGELTLKEIFKIIISGHLVRDFVRLDEVFAEKLLTSERKKWPTA